MTEQLTLPGGYKPEIKGWQALLSPKCISSVQSLSRVRLSVTPWTAARQASVSFTISQSLLKLMSMESMMPSNRLILCCPRLLLPSIFPSIRVFGTLCKMWLCPLAGG